MKINWPITIQEDKYSKWYEQLIENARIRKTINGYSEQHHVIPNCFLKNHDVVTLTAREHYIAHLLLWRMKMSPKNHNKMTMALNIMVNGSGNKLQDRSYVVNSRIYEMHRKEYSKTLSESMQGEKNHFYGKKHSLETRQKIIEANKRTYDIRSAKFKGELNPMYGKTHSEEMRKQISKSVAETWTDEKKLAKSEWAKDKWKDPEYRKHMIEVRKTSPSWLNRNWKEIAAKALAGRIANGTNRQTPESIAKMKATKAAKKAAGWVSPMKGKKLDHLSGRNSPKSRSWDLVSPTNQLYQGVGQKELVQLCKELKIGYWSANDLLRGKKGKNQLYLEGWTATYK